MMKTFTDELEEIFGSTNTQEYAEARLALEIAVQFAALRERRGLSQRQLAERLGRTQQAVSKIENPSHAGHNLTSLKSALEALDATLDVTIVPLEDLDAYDACRPPKPALEDIRRRTLQEAAPHNTVQETAIGSSCRHAIRPSSKRASRVEQITTRLQQSVPNQLTRQLPSTVQLGWRRP